MKLIDLEKYVCDKAYSEAAALLSQPAVAPLPESEQEKFLRLALGVYAKVSVQEMSELIESHPELFIAIANNAPKDSKESGKFFENIAYGVTAGSWGITTPLRQTIIQALRLRDFAADTVSQEKFLGEGVSGQVFKGTVVDSQDLYALKKENPDWGTDFDSEIFINAFLQRMIEIFPAQSEHYSKIIKFYGRQVEPENVLVFELGSTDLSLAINEPGNTWTVQRKLQICLDIIKGLSYLHFLNIIAVDLKSNNIIMMPDGTAKLADFGNSMLESHAKEELEPCGTFAYYPYELLATYFSDEDLNNLPPELNEFLGMHSKASDIFSFGVVMFELFMQFMPYKAAFDAIARDIGHGDQAQQLTFPEKAALLEEKCAKHAIKDQHKTPISLLLATPQASTLVSLISSLWLVDPARRPDASMVRSTVTKLYQNSGHAPSSPLPPKKRIKLTSDVS